MALQSEYCTVAEADVFLADSAVWLAVVDDADKDLALYWGQKYIDANYNCIDWSTLDAYPEELKYANALLAEAYVDGTLFEIDPSGNRVLTSKRVKAGDVEIEKRYQGDRAFSVGNAIDQFPEVTALLAEYCSKAGKTSLIMRV